MIFFKERQLTMMALAGIMVFFCMCLSQFSFAQKMLVQANDWAYGLAGIDSNFKKVTGKKIFRVAIIDNAFDIDKTNLLNFLDTNYAEIPGNGFDDDGNGKTDDYMGWDFADNDNNVQPPPSKSKPLVHGTKVADIFIQTISRILENPRLDIRILPIKANADISQNNYITEGYKGIAYALSMKVDMIITSWSFFELKESEQSLLEKAKQQGVIMVGSAGNFLYEQPQYPASFPWVINVAALDRNLLKQPASNFGQGIDIAAPGDSLVVIHLGPDQPPAYLSATSAATPLAAGVIAALSSAFPQLLASDIDRVIKNSAKPLDSINWMYSGKMGAGIIQAQGMVDYLTNGESAPTFTQPKGYLNLSSLTAGKNYTLAPVGNYKDIRLMMPPGTVIDHDVHIKWRHNETTKDTILTPKQMLYPLVLRAEKIWVEKQAAATGVVTTPAWWYYEVQTTDSSILYCNGTIDIEGTEGFIEDGSGAAGYTGRSNCKWLIKVPEGKKIKFEFTEMDLEIKKDQLYIFNGVHTNATILAIFSGPKPPPIVTSWGNMALIWFISSETNHGKGWKLHYTAVD
ncbi:MAG: S8 family serine peptidase [Bacteroidota bacterium]